eukprot:403335307
MKTENQNTQINDQSEDSNDFPDNVVTKRREQKQKQSPKKQVKTNEEGEKPLNRDQVVKKYLEELKKQQSKEEMKKEKVVNVDKYKIGPPTVQKFFGEADLFDIPKKGHMSIWQWNINGLQAVVRKNALQDFLKNYQPLILCINELKTDFDKINQLQIHKQLPKNYEQYWNCCSTKKGYAGTGLLTKIKPLKVTFGLGIEKHDTEGRIMTAEYDHFIVVNSYFPNTGFNFERIDYRIDEWDEDVHDYIDHLRDTSKKPVILAGDLNIGNTELDIYHRPWARNFRQGQHPKEYDSLQRLLDRGYIDAYRHLYPNIRGYSYWSSQRKAKEKDNGCRCDYFILNKEHFEMVIDSRMHRDVEGSDHVPIELEIDIQKLRGYSKSMKLKSKKKLSSNGKESSNVNNNKQSMKKQIIA